MRVQSFNSFRFHVHPRLLLSRDAGAPNRSCAEILPNMQTSEVNADDQANIMRRALVRVGLGSRVPQPHLDPRHVRHMCSWQQDPGYVRLPHEVATSMQGEAPLQHLECLGTATFQAAFGGLLHSSQFRPQMVSSIH